MRDQVTNCIKNYFSNPSKAIRSCFVYDLQNVDKSCEELKEHLAPVANLYYAMKANPHTKVLSYLTQKAAISGVDVSSGGELILASEKWSADQLLFTGPGKSPAELELAVNSGIGLIIVESLTEAFRLNQVAQKRLRRQDVLLRINIAKELGGANLLMSGFSSKFGIDESAATNAAKVICQLPNLRFRGIHCYAASGFLRAEDVLAQFAHVLRFAAQLRRTGVPFDTLDLGGGFGIDYTEKEGELDIGSVGKGLAELIKTHGLGDCKIILELGRFVIGNAGVYCSEILDIKISEGKKHLIVAGGINHQRRPCATDSNHKVSIIGMHWEKIWSEQESVRAEVVDIDGPLCLAPDKLAWDVLIDKAEIGDIVIVHRSGAYGASMGATHFISHEPAPELFVPAI